MRLPLLTAVVALVPALAPAQTRNLQELAERRPAGIAVPGASVAGAEEPADLLANPAALGFVGGATLQYFHQGRFDSDQGADGFWVATPLGPIVPALSMQWIRPAEGQGARFRRTTAALGVGLAHWGALAVGSTWLSSPAPDLDGTWTLDLGLTVRPWRHLSVGAAVLGLRAAGARLPVAYDLGVATRLWDDRLTLSADLLTDDAGRGDLGVRAVALGAGVELGAGLIVKAQVQLPLQDAPGPAGAAYGQLALGFDTAHAGVTASAATGDGAEGTWLLGARLSAERYRGARLGGDAPDLDLGRLLSPERSFFPPADVDPYRTVLRRLVEARDDTKVAALLVRIADVPLGQGRVEELRRLLLDVKARKPVVAYLTGGGMKAYYLASAATVVLAPPSAALYPLGLSSSAFFLRDALGKLGVRFDVVAAGRYKSAPDPLVRQEMSEAQREVTSAVLDDVFARQVRGIAEARRLPEARVRELLDAGALGAEQAVAAGLVDRTAWPDELQRALSDAAGRDVRLAAGWDRSPPRAAQRWGPRRAIGLVRVEGAIATGTSRANPLGGMGIAGADTVTAQVHRAVADPEVAALVVRVESPGGDALASDLVWRALVEARRAGKPVVVSMGDLAASGGYLLAMGADAVLAEPSTLTGSVGVFVVKPDLSALLSKLGVNAVTLKRGERADLDTATRGWTEAERRVVEGQVDAFYELFLARVAEGRRLPRAEVERLAGGRVWTGAQALERKLVDGLGGLPDAVRLAAARAALDPDEVEVRAFEPERGFATRVLAGLAAEQPPTLLATLGRVPELQALSLLLELGPLLALPPEWLEGASGGP